MGRYLDLAKNISPSLSSKEDINVKDRKSLGYERNESDEKTPSTPLAILGASQHGSLTRGALRDALVIRTGCSLADAELVIGVNEEAGIIVCDEDGLYRR